VRGRFQATEKYDIDDAPASFEEVSFQLRIDSSARPEAVAKLVAHAERGCHSAQTIRNPVAVRLSAMLNGVELDLR
jgi:organic hydroperoxide reductase OsmC/OhrA